jgi:hypothetical protein
MAYLKACPVGEIDLATALNYSDSGMNRDAVKGDAS